MKATAIILIFLFMAPVQAQPVERADGTVLVASALTDAPSEPLATATLVLPDGRTLAVVGGCWLSEKTCIGTARLEEQYEDENKRLRQEVLDATKNQWAFVTAVSGVVAVIAFGAGWYTSRLTGAKP